MHPTIQAHRFRCKSILTVPMQSHNPGQLKHRTPTIGSTIITVEVYKSIERCKLNAILFPSTSLINNPCKEQQQTRRTIGFICQRTDTGVKTFYFTRSSCFSKYNPDRCHCIRNPVPPAETISSGLRITENVERRGIRHRSAATATGVPKSCRLPVDRECRVFTRTCARRGTMTTPGPRCPS